MVARPASTSCFDSCPLPARMEQEERIKDDSEKYLGAGKAVERLRGLPTEVSVHLALSEKASTVRFAGIKRSVEMDESRTASSFWPSSSESPSLLLNYFIQGELFDWNSARSEQKMGKYPSKS